MFVEPRVFDEKGMVMQTPPQGTQTDESAGKRVASERVSCRGSFDGPGAPDKNQMSHLTGKNAKTPCVFPFLETRKKSNESNESNEPGNFSNESNESIEGRAHMPNRSVAEGVANRRSANLPMR